MEEKEVQNKITSLPLSQQVALWVILRMNRVGESDFSFFSSQFAKEFKPFVKKHLSANPDEYGKFVGATLSGLIRNDILTKLTGDRDKLWTLSKEVKNNYQIFKKKLFEVKAYWS